MLLILHLSDIHLHGPIGSNPIFRKIERVATVAGEIQLVRTTKPTDVVVVLSGDIAFGGARAEFELATALLERLSASIQKTFGVAPIYIIAPGNHDCDFSVPNELRTTLLKNLDPVRVEAGIEEACTKVQSEFFAFRDRHSPVGRGNSLHQEHDIALRSGKIVRFSVLNSAWMSSLNEDQGSLVFPLHRAASLQATDGCDLSVVVLHHPFGWFESNNARQLRELIETSAGVILTGHEHDAAQYRKTKPSSNHDYLEGSALQPHGGPDESGFNVVMIDFERGEQATASVEWDGKKYTIDVGTTSVPLIQDRDSYRRRYRFSAEFMETLEDPGAAYEHPRKQKLVLQDLFVYPDFVESELQGRADRQRHVRERHLDNIISRKRVLIVGEEMSGKSALARQLTYDLQRRGIVPVLLSGRDLKSPKREDVDDWVRTAFLSQFATGNGLWNDFVQCPSERRAVVVDDLHAIGFDMHHRESICAQLTNLADLSVLLGADHWGFDDIHAAQAGLETLWSFNRLKILEMGYVKRSELITQWCRIGNPYMSESAETWKKVSTIEKHVDMVIQNSLLPSYAGNVLMLVSLLEAGGGAAGNRTSAVLYESMMTRRLSAVVTASSDINTMYEYLAVFAFRLFGMDTRDVTTQQFKLWHDDYCARYAVEMESSRTLRQACDAQVLRERHGRIGFRYPYAYFYFVARYLDRQLGSEPARKIVAELCQRLHREDAANIMLFLCYLTNDEFVLDTMVAAATSRLRSHGEFDIGHVDPSILSLIGSVPSPVLPSGTTEERRRSVREEQDQLAEADRARRESDDAFMQDLHGAFKTVELFGELLRNYPGSIVAPRKRQLAEEAYALTLRTIRWWFDIVEEHREGLITAYAHAICKRHGDLEGDAEALRGRVQQWLFNLSSGWTTWMIRQLSCAVGSDALTPTFREIVDHHLSTKASYGVIDLSIKLDLNRAFPQDEIAALAARLKDNPLALSVLQNLVIHHIRVFPVARKDQQFACSKLSIRPSHPDFFDKYAKKLA